MKKLMLFALVLSLTSMMWAGGKEDSLERLTDAGQVLDEIMSAPDKGIPEEVIDNARCIAVVPRMVKAAFIFGGKHGRGVATCRTATVLDGCSRIGGRCCSPHGQRPRHSRNGRRPPPPATACECTS